MNKITDETIFKNLSTLKSKISLPNKLKSCDFNRERNKKALIPFLTVATCLVLIVLIGVTPVFSQTLKKFFKIGSADKGIITADNNNGATNISKSVMNKNIKVTLKGVICDGIRTAISVRFESDTISMESINLDGVSLTDSNGKVYLLSHYGQGEIVNGQKAYETSVQFTGSPVENTILKLQISSINNIKGNWNFSFNGYPTKSSNFKADNIYTDKDISLSVSNVIFTSTYTIVEGNIKGSDFNFLSTLSNLNKETVEQLSGEKDKDGNFKIYFSPLAKTDDLVLKINSAENASNIIIMEINLEN